MTRQVQEAQARRNEASKAIGAAMGKGDTATAEALKAEVAQLKDTLPQLEEEDRALGAELEALVADALALLPELYGGAEVLAAAEKRLPKLPELTRALATLKALAKACPVPASFDLAELRGYHYHSGVVFDAYCKGVTGAVARGGRYDEIGKAFGRSRPATGFSIDLRSLAGANGGKARGKVTR